MKVEAEALEAIIKSLRLSGYYLVNFCEEANKDLEEHIKYYLEHNDCDPLDNLSEVAGVISKRAGKLPEVVMKTPGSDPNECINSAMMKNTAK